MKTAFAKQNMAVRTAVLLLFLILCSLFINSGMFARYTTANSSQDSAHVASFSVLPDNSYTSPAIVFANMAPGETKDYSFTVSSASEVAVALSMSLSTTGNLPLTFTLLPGNIAISPNTATHIIDLTANHGDATLTLRATWPESEKSTAYLNEIDSVSLTVTATQID